MGRKDDPRTTGDESMKRAKLALVIILVIAVIVVIVQNTAAVETRLLFVTVTMPRALLLLITLAAGFVLGVVFSFPSTRKKEPSHD